MWAFPGSRVAPQLEDWPALIAKSKSLDQDLPALSADTIRALAAPTLLIIGDSAIVWPEHAVELFRLLGGGVIGDMAGRPKSQLASLPGTTHVTLVQCADLLSVIVPSFRDAPLPAND